LLLHSDVPSILKRFCLKKIIEQLFEQTCTDFIAKLLPFLHTEGLILAVLSQFAVRHGYA